ncbi:MAG: (d)CMP kinase [Planctomycetota bacterium]|nr:(d)CMP kinase [Planctomycetota bacterium]
MIIAIDGPAASGKSTAARSLAKRLGITFLDTGAMYRAVTLEVLRRDVDPTDAAACVAVAEAIELSFDAEGRILIGGAPGEPEVRSEAVNSRVSEVAAHSGVRRVMVAVQRRIGEQASAGSSGELRGVVAEGRDMTSVVFPDADLKVFLVASPRERARRRAEEEGRPERAAEYEADITRRDEYDSRREDSPLIQVEGALRLETDELTADQVLERLVAEVEALPG